MPEAGGGIQQSLSEYATGFFVNGLGFRVPNISGIPNSLSFIPDSKVQDSTFHRPKFSRFRNPVYLIWGAICLECSCLIFRPTKLSIEKFSEY